MKKNGFISISIICLMVLSIFIGCENKDEIIHLEDLTSTKKVMNEQDQVKETEKSVVIVSTNWPPYEFEEDNQIKGIGVDIAEEAFNRMGYKVNKESLPFTRAIEMLEKGEIDMIIDVKNTVERQKIGTFSNEPIFTTRTTLFVRRDSDIEFDGDILDLKNYKIGTVSNFFYGDDFIMQ